MAHPAPIDRTRYMVTPRSTVSRNITLGRLMLAKPITEPSPDVAVMGERLDAELVAAQAAVHARYTEDGPSVAAAEQSVDAHVDALERCRDQRLEHWERFDNPMVGEFANRQRREGKPPGEYDYVAAYDRSQDAKRLRKLLYPSGLEFTRLSYLEQANVLSTIAAVIENDGCRARLDQLVGADINAAIEDGYAQYQAMISRRTDRARGSEVDLRQVNYDLQRAIQNYTVALLAMIRDEDPDNVAMIRRALRPLDAVREANLIERGRVSGDDEVTELDSEAIQELLDAQRALDVELGLAEPERAVTEPPPLVPAPAGAE